MSSKSMSKQEEALQFLDDLDSLSPKSTGVNVSPPAGPPATNPSEAAEVLAFLDEITQKSKEPTRTTTSNVDRPLSRAGTPTLRKSTERVRVGTSTQLPASAVSSTKGPSPSTSSTNLISSAKQENEPSTRNDKSSGGWGWGRVWSSASAALQQAKTAVDDQVKHLPKQDQARQWSENMLEYARNAQLDKLGW
jgi:Family of unknown function (DUF5427)